jgi:hypothetical protein
MKSFTITLDEQRLATLSGLILAAGKSPMTEGQGLMASAEMLQWLQNQVAKSASEAGKVVDLPQSKDDAA